jgi:hypothetical protein
MRPEIEAYLREHVDQYTPEALRRELVAAGYDPGEVDAALREMDGIRSAAGSAKPTRWRFWLVALALHAAALAVAGIWIANSASGTYFGIIIIVLAVALLIGLGISGLIGRWLLPRAGLAVALVVPLLSALILGGTCMAMSGPLVAQPRTGTMELHLLAPRTFTGSGPAVCHFSSAGGVAVSAENLGMSDGRTVMATLDAIHSKGVTAAPSSASGANLVISLLGSDTKAPETYSTIFSTRQTVEVAADQLSGKVNFQGLALEGQPGQAISGSLTWTCR